MENYSLPERSALKQSKILESAGYSDRFILENGRVRCTRTNEYYSPEDFTIICASRFEGVSDPDDMEVLYVIEAKNGRRGIIQDAFGTYASPEVGNIVSRMKDLHRSHLERKTVLA